MIYEALVKPMLFRMEPEEAHDFVLRNLQRIQRQPGLLYLIEKLYGVREEPGLASELLGIRFPSPIGLAAGLDKDARAVPALSSMGFGFLEVGSVTPIGQVGNDRPRLFRLPDDEALINRMGFNNGGIQAMKERLESCNALKIPLGINIGKTNRRPMRKRMKTIRSASVPCIRMRTFLSSISVRPTRPTFGSFSTGASLMNC